MLPAHRTPARHLFRPLTALVAAVAVLAAPATASGDQPHGGAGASTITARADAQAQRLMAGTRQLADSQRRLAAAVARLQQARVASTEAHRALAAATDGLNDFAAAAYRDSAAPELSLLLQLGEADPQDAVTAAGYLDQAGQQKAEVLATLRAAATRAAAAGAIAEQASQQAAAAQQQVIAKVSELRTAATAGAASLGASAAASRAASRRPLPATDLASLVAAGYPNGLIPASALCATGIGTNVLRCDAAAGVRTLAPAFAAAFGRPICITDSYRSYPQQVAVYRERPSLAAVPGTSNHGWGLALDLCGGAQSAGTAEDRWLHANAGRFGWTHPAWAEPGGSRPEPWHWEYVGQP